MSAEFPTLAEVLRGHISDGCDCCSCGWRYSWKEGAPGWSSEWSAHAADAWHAARTIMSTDQLDALPHKSLVLVEYTSRAGWHHTEVWGRRNEVWHCLAAPLSPPSRHDGTPNLPALLLWHPSWSQS